MASRQMLAEDARWVADIVLSARQAHDVFAYPALLLGHHFVRIAYEGSIAIRSANPHVGLRPLAELLTNEFAAITARGRHVSKVFDDTKKGYEGVLADLDRELRHNKEVLKGRTSRWFRWMARDLGLYSIDEDLVGASIPMAYRLGLDPVNAMSLSGASLTAVSHEWGRTTAVLSAADLLLMEPEPTLDLSRIEVSYADRDATKYLGRRYEPGFPPSLKTLLLMLEGDLNTLRAFVPLTAPGHENAVFRARTVTVYHSLTAARRVADRFSDLRTPAMNALRDLLAAPAAQSLLCREALLVRNRCVHYEMNDPAIKLNPDLPMNGVVEAVYPTTTWDGFNQAAIEVSEKLAILLNRWRTNQ